MSDSEKTSLDDKVVSLFLGFVAYAISSLLAILLANELWYWGQADSAQVENGQRSALWVVGVRLLIFSARGLFQPHAWRNARTGMISIIAMVSLGSLILWILNVMFGDAVAPSAGILLLDALIQICALGFVGTKFWWKRQ